MSLPGAVSLQAPIPPPTKIILCILKEGHTPFFPFSSTPGWMGDTYALCEAADLSLNLECSLIGYYAICSLPHCLILMPGTDLRICN